jgi:hypothetical protein
LPVEKQSPTDRAGIFLTGRKKAFHAKTRRRKATGKGLVKPNSETQRTEANEGNEGAK